MAHIIREKMSHPDDARSLLGQVYGAEADLLPDMQANTLTVCLPPNEWQLEAEASGPDKRKNRTKATWGGEVSLRAVAKWYCNGWASWRPRHFRSLWMPNRTAPFENAWLASVAAGIAIARPVHAHAQASAIVATASGHL